MPVLLENHMPSATLAPTPSAPSHDTTPAAPPPRATDDEILGITSPRKNSPRDTQQLEFDFDADVPTPTTTLSSRARAGVWPDEGLAVPSANENQLQIPRSARNDNTLPDANANTDAPGATSANADGLRTAGVSPAPLTPSPHAQLATNSATANEPQLAFLHAANAAAVEGVVAAIEAQVERLLPEGVAKNARTRVVGEIYRELDSSLRSNPQFAAQLRDAFRSGSFDDGHQRAIVSLLTGRARQALPGVAKRVLSEWTSTIVSAANERRTRQRTAERRIDIAGSSGAGNDGRRSMSPRDLDYARLTDADILNL
jgi:hypothetical protein